MSCLRVVIVALGFHLCSGATFSPNSADVRATTSTDKNAYLAGDDIVVTFANATKQKDWLGIYKTNASSDSGSIEYLYVDGTTDAAVLVTAGNITFKKNTLAPGEYDVIFMEDNGYKEIAKRAKFTVVKCEFSLDKKKYKHNETVRVTFCNSDADGKLQSPGAQDWIGIFKKGEVPGQGGVKNLWYLYCCGTGSCSKKTQAGLVEFSYANKPELEHNGGKFPFDAGEYWAYYLADDDYQAVLSHNPYIAFTVDGPITTTTSGTTTTITTTTTTTTTLGTTTTTTRVWCKLACDTASSTRMVLATTVALVVALLQLVRMP